MRAKDRLVVGAALALAIRAARRGLDHLEQLRSGVARGRRGSRRGSRRRRARGLYVVAASSPPEEAGLAPGRRLACSGERGRSTSTVRAPRRQVDEESPRGEFPAALRISVQSFSSRTEGPRCRAPSASISPSSRALAPRGRPSGHAELLESSSSGAGAPRAVAAEQAALPSCA